MTRKHPQQDTSKFHSLQPNYQRPVFDIPDKFKQKLKEKLVFLYGNGCGENCLNELQRIIKVYLIPEGERRSKLNFVYPHLT